MYENQRTTGISFSAAGLLLAAILAFAACFCACSPSRPEQKLLGKWRSQPTPNQLCAQYQYEFLEKGNVAVSGMLTNHNRPAGWDQYATGTYELIDPAHLKIDL
jgi:hypothetical protein